jgi:multisubunit Na+/H+ antiporter MnhB subunit
MNFNRPFWLKFFCLLVLALLGYGGTKATPIVFRFFHIHYEKLGLQDWVSAGFALMAGIGFYGAAIVAIWCLFSAVLSLLRSRHPKS